MVSEKVDYVPLEVAEMVEAGLKQINQTQQSERIIRETTEMANRQTWTALRQKHSLYLPDALRKFLSDRWVQDPEDENSTYEHVYLQDAAPDRGDVWWMLRIPGLAPIEVKFVGMSSGPVENTSTIPAWKVSQFVIGEWIAGDWHFNGFPVKGDELHLMLGEARRRYLDHRAWIDQRAQAQAAKIAAQPAKPEPEYIPVDDPISIPEVGENVLNIVRRLVRQEMQIAAQS